jgi:molecular chaperone DnaK
MSFVIPVGIDLGTTNSAAAIVTAAGQTEMVPNEFGEVLTPSAVFFAPQGVIVGNEALKAAEYAPETVIESPKRFMGLPDCERTIHGYRPAPEVVQALILRQLRRDIEAVMEDAFEVVITVPAFFDEVRRQRTVTAGEMAGLKVLDVVNEPTAAALAFGEQLGYLRSGGERQEPLSLLVYDLGGGTFDVTAIRMAAADIRTLATGGDVHLGGRDWDRRLVDYVSQKFEARRRMDPREDMETTARLAHQVNEAKHTLAVRRHTKVSVDYAREHLEVSISRETFEDLTESLADRTLVTVREVMDAADLEWAAVSKILLVGGATRMPSIAKSLERESGVAPESIVNPDEAVARGAAIRAAARLAERDGQPSLIQCRIVDVNSHSLGIEGIDRSTDSKVNTILIPRNTPLPAIVTKRFVTKETNQKSIAIRVLEGEHSRPEDCLLLGKAVLRGLPDSARRSRPVDVTYEYDAGGRLRVRAELPRSDHRIEVQLQRDQTLRARDVEVWKKALSEESRLTFEQLLEQFIRESIPDE